MEGSMGMAVLLGKRKKHRIYYCRNCNTDFYYKSLRCIYCELPVYARKRDD